MNKSKDRKGSSEGRSKPHMGHIQPPAMQNEEEDDDDRMMMMMTTKIQIMVILLYHQNLTSFECSETDAWVVNVFAASRISTQRHASFGAISRILLPGPKCR